MGSKIRRDIYVGDYTRHVLVFLLCNDGMVRLYEAITMRKEHHKDSIWVVHSKCTGTEACQRSIIKPTRSMIIEVVEEFKTQVAYEGDFEDAAMPVEMSKEGSDDDSV